MVYSTDRSKAVVPVLVLLFVALCFILQGDLLYVLPCVILFVCFFSPFSIAITSPGEERANLSAFRTFVRFVLVWICRFPLPLGVWEGLQFVIVALPGLFSYPFLSNIYRPLFITSNQASDKQFKSCYITRSWSQVRTETVPVSETFLLGYVKRISWIDMA